ncbi:MAG: DMT family transporter [Pseudomonadota bacterium]
MIARFLALPGNLRGAILMSIAALVFTVEALFTRWMSDRGISVTTQLLARSLGQVVWILPTIAASGLVIFRTRKLALHLARGFSSVSTWGLYFLSFALLDLATATVLSFTNVMFTTLAAGPLLRERVTAARWAGTIAGFCGVAIMLRPGTDIPLGGAAAAIGAALCWCGITLSSRALTRTETTRSVIAWVGLVTTLCATPLAIIFWQPISLTDALILAVFGLTTPTILLLMTEAFRAGEASAVAPFQYLRLPVLILAGWLIFAEAPDAAAWAGAAIILVGATIITIAEARAAR